MLRKLAKSKWAAVYGWAVAVGMCIWFGVEVGWWLACVLLAVAVVAALAVGRLTRARRA
jgi:hypothetical protein